MEKEKETKPNPLVQILFKDATTTPYKASSDAEAIHSLPIIHLPPSIQNEESMDMGLQQGTVELDDDVNLYTFESAAVKEIMHSSSVPRIPSFAYTDATVPGSETVACSILSNYLKESFIFS